MIGDKECFVLKRNHVEMGLGMVKNKIIIQDPEKGRQVYLTVEWVSKPDNYKEKITIVAEEEVSYL